MSAPPELSESLKQQRDLAAFYEGRVRDLGTPIVQAWQTIPLLFSILALLTAGKVFRPDQLPSALFLVTIVGAGLVFVVRNTHERRAQQVKQEYEREYQLLFGEPPRIELIGFALPAKRLRSKSR